MKDLGTLEFVNNCTYVLNEEESRELKKYIDTAIMELPIKVSSDDAQNKKGWINTDNINVSYGVRSNAGQAYVEIGASTKLRGLIPSIFGGITGKGKTLSTSIGDKFDPFIILSFLGKFIEFIQILAEGLGEIWKKLDAWLKDTDAKDNMKTKAYKSKNHLEEKKDELNFANASVNAKIPSDVFPKVKTPLANMQAMSENQSGMGIYKIFQDGRKEQVVDPNGVLADVLIVDAPSNKAIRIETNVVGLLFIWLSPTRQNDGGNIWGRWHIYEQE